VTSSLIFNLYRHIKYNRVKYGKLSWHKDHSNDLFGAANRIRIKVIFDNNDKTGIPLKVIFITEDTLPLEVP